MKHIAISIEYAGLTLPLVKFDDGHTRLPLKPLCAAAGVDYAGQYQKLRGDRLGGNNRGKQTHLARSFGLATGHAVFGGQRRELVMIRADRVLAFFSSINPTRVRSAGNVEGAEFIESKRALLFALESAGIRQADTVSGDVKARRHRNSSYRAIARALLIAAIDEIDDPVLQAFALAEIGIHTPASGDLFGQG